MSDTDDTGAAGNGDYSLDPDDQLQPEDTLIDRGVDDILDEGISPPERPLGLDAHGLTGSEESAGRPSTSAWPKKNPIRTRRSEIL